MIKHQKVRVPEVSLTVHDLVLGDMFTCPDRIGCRVVFMRGINFTGTQLTGSNSGQVTAFNKNTECTEVFYEMHEV